jgi:predicted nuclease of restriction endonuclease-like (RecB) superfamily
MSAIVDLLSELNELCKQYVFNNDSFAEQGRIRELISEILELGFDFEMVNLDGYSTVYELLTEKGKSDYNTKLEITKLKMEAIRLQQYERAAYLRDQERQLTKAINTEYIQSTDRLFFILKENSSDTILFVDSERMLKGMFTNYFP